MTNVNDYKGLTDSEVIENAIKNKQKDGIVIISPREKEIEPERDWWLLDRAILIPENTTIILQNCRIKLSDKCRDNFFRTENCGLGIAYPEKIENVHIIGVGSCILEGADHPRATGDGSKILACPCPYTVKHLCEYADWITEEEKSSGVVCWTNKHNHSYGTDVNKEDESHYGDWRGIGVLFANVDRFSIENLRLVDSHGWGISVEACTNGLIKGINFEAYMHKEIDGLSNNMENQDGIDIRNGCNHIIISDITGRTGDDLIALTAIKTEGNFKPGGSLRTSHVMHNDWTKRDCEIHDIIIRNVIGHSSLCYTIRFLPGNTKMYNIIVDGVNAIAPEGVPQGGAILLGDLTNPEWGDNLLDGLTNITISNVISNSGVPVLIQGYLSDSIISNIINLNPYTKVIDCKLENGMKNVITSNLCDKRKQ